MLTAFWSGLGGEFAKNWASRLLTPAFAFWIGGLGALWWHSHAAAVHRHGLVAEVSSSLGAVGKLPGVVQGVLLVAALMLIAVSALAAERLTLPLLRFLEGYWTHPRAVRGWLIDRRRKRRAAAAKTLAGLATRQRLGALTTPEFVEWAALEANPTDPSRLASLRQRQASGFGSDDLTRLGRCRAAVRLSPATDAAGMPTRLGDILRAAEQRPAAKYGIDAVATWYALWLVLPAETKSEVVAARSALDALARAWLWGALFIVWTPWAWWAAPVAVVVPWVIYAVGIVPAAIVFGDLSEAAYDLHRFLLYDALLLPRPASPNAERRVDGPRLTRFLWVGISDPNVSYNAGAAGGT